jgi:hypothetical protein
MTIQKDNSELGSLEDLFWLLIDENRNENLIYLVKLFSIALTFNACDVNFKVGIYHFNSFLNENQ